MECDYLCGWIKKKKKKKSHIHKNITQNGEPQKYSWRTEEEEKKKKHLEFYVLVGSRGLEGVLERGWRSEGGGGGGGERTRAGEMAGKRSGQVRQVRMQKS